MSDDNEGLPVEISTAASARIEAAIKGAADAMLKSEACFAIAASPGRPIAERRSALEGATAALDDAERHLKVHFSELRIVLEEVARVGHDVTKNVEVARRTEENALLGIEKEREKARELDRALQLGGKSGGSA